MRFDAARESVGEMMMMMVVVVAVVVDVVETLAPGGAVVSVSVETGLCLNSWHFFAV